MTDFINWVASNMQWPITVGLVGMFLAGILATLRTRNLLALIATVAVGIMLFGQLSYLISGGGTDPEPATPSNSVENIVAIGGMILSIIFIVVLPNARGKLAGVMLFLIGLWILLT